MTYHINCFFENKYFSLLYYIPVLISILEIDCIFISIFHFPFSEIFSPFQVYIGNHTNVANAMLVHHHQKQINHSGKVEINFQQKNYGKNVFIILPGSKRKLILCEVKIGEGK